MTNPKHIEKALFEVARELDDPQARIDFLDMTCFGKPELRGRLEKLLSARDSAEAFFDLDPLQAGREATDPATHSPARRPPLPLEAVNMDIGRYRLIQRLGEGGCGVVYEAEQQEPVRRRVALKIIRLGMDTESVVARFEAERQALAMMDHPNIAHVLDAGATESGRPYFVMELVSGVRITDYCDKHRLGTTQRLKLFVQICHAIQHAHQKGVIHRDIKPSNILVTSHDNMPIPKVIDFGIAKATQGRLTDSTLYTAGDQFIGTPVYMSPEQADGSGLDVDTRSDIYSLGVLLYEMLTGRTPFDTKLLLKMRVDDMRRTLRESEPRSPSLMLSTLENSELVAIAGKRHLEPPKLISSVRGDLDWIVMKALEKDRQRRYETVNALAMDIERHLGNEPIIACPPSRLYRFQKLVRRNTGTFAAATAVSVALLIGLGSSTWLFIKERESRREAERGRANEILLRRQAEAREKISQAAVLVGQNRLEEADRLVASLPFPETALEGATVFRTLGDWTAVRSQWTRAAEHLAMLLRVDLIETFDVSTLDHTRCAVALIEGGDLGKYDLFRQASIKHFSGTKNPVVAERTIKNSLLFPADKALIATLDPLAQVAMDSYQSAEKDEVAAPWGYVSIALMEYRRGHFPEAADWCRRCLAAGNEAPAREATARAILAMTCHRLGRTDEGRAELSQSRSLIENRIRRDFDVGDGARGFWFDWMLGQILLREAISLIGEPR